MAVSNVPVTTVRSLSLYPVRIIRVLNVKTLILRTGKINPDREEKIRIDWIENKAEYKAGIMLRRNVRVSQSFWNSWRIRTIDNREYL